MSEAKNEFMKNTDNESHPTDCSPRHAAVNVEGVFSEEEQQEGSPRECPKCGQELSDCSEYGVSDLWCCECLQWRARSPREKLIENIEGIVLAWFFGTGIATHIAYFKELIGHVAS